MPARTSAIIHSQNANGFVCGLSTRKTVTPRSIQNSTTSRSSSQSSRACGPKKLKLTMSWYFLGGFSAYLIVPSGRTENHSGCSRTYGWSGEHCSATSSAISSPAARADSTKRAKSSSVPRRGSIAVWPPFSLPIAQGLPTSSGPGSSVLFLPLRNARPIGWIGGR